MSPDQELKHVTSCITDRCNHWATAAVPRSNDVIKIDVIPHIPKVCQVRDATKLS